ncbi:MAG: hemolysin family protein [Planctomycetota bacterium]
MAILVLAVCILLVCSAVTSMVEAAVFSVPLSKVQLAYNQERHGARRLRRIKEDMRRPVATLVVLNNCVNIGGSIYVGSLAESVLGSGESGEGWISVFSAILTFLVIIFAEIIPKTLGERFAENIALNAAPVLLIVTGLIHPLIWILERVTRPFTGQEQSTAPSEEEISALAQVGKIDGHESELIQRAFQLNDVTAEEIMTHRLKLAYLPADRRLSDIKTTDIDLSFSRLVVTEGDDLDKIRGVVLQRELLLALAEGNCGNLTIGDLKKEVPFVYESTPAHKLLQNFLRKRQHLFVVVDEYGGTHGIVTLEDVLEELVGEIHDETDPVDDVQLSSAQLSATDSSATARPAS